VVAGDRELPSGEVSEEREALGERFIAHAEVAREEEDVARARTVEVRGEPTRAIDPLDAELRLLESARTAFDAAAFAACTSPKS
jgi:hypothetical protein